MIDLAVVKSHLRVEHDDEDALIQDYTDAAFAAFQDWTNRKLVATETDLPDPVGSSMVITSTIKQGALLLIGQWYKNREATLIGASVAMIPLATEALWKPHRWVSL
jgi:oligoribonuclease (3'-5' exoribonuclease)